MLEHTPGPWKAQKHTHGYEVVADLGMGTNHTIADLYDIPGEGLEKEKANAQLIAAAPALFVLAELVSDGNTEYDSLQSKAKRLIEKIRSDG